MIIFVAVSLVVGSFIGVVILRLPAERAVIVDRSRCASCGVSLSPRDLVPLFSWLANGGRCRFCDAPVEPFYPCVEVAAMLVAIWSVVALPAGLAWVGASYGWTLLTLAWIDLRNFTLHDVLVLPLGAAGVVTAWVIDPALLHDSLLGLGAGLGSFLGIGVAYRALRGRDGLGQGDAKLLGALGAWVGWQGLPTVVLYAAASALLVLLVAALRGRTPRLGQRIPFGTYLCLGGWLVWLYGPLYVE